MKILVIMSSFHGMNIPTMLYELNVNFNNNLLYETYLSHEVMIRKGNWADRQWHNYSLKCLPYHMNEDHPLFVPSCQDKEDDYTNAESIIVKEKTYKPDSIEENWAARQELGELITMYLLVVDEIYGRYDILPDIAWNSNDTPRQWQWDGLDRLIVA